jgi:hypothetical protein
MCKNRDNLVSIIKLGVSLQIQITKYEQRLFLLRDYYKTVWV